MCGICGVVDFRGADLSCAIQDMTRALLHRGPDFYDTRTDGTMAFGHARLSILDLSQNGHQPMLSRDERYLITYNGEVYNFRDLRQELERAGFSFCSRSDTEVVLNAFLHWGTGAFTKFNGMFALAIWDRQNQLLVLARDRFGIKPLYYFQQGEKIVFASEIKAILTQGDIGRELNYAALHEYLYFSSSLGENTFFQGIRKLAPGSFLRFSRQELVTSSYIGDLYKKTAPDMTFRPEQLREKLDSAVRRHLVSDVPVGIFLSGGMDSSTITALAARHYGGRLQTFSVGYDLPGAINELPKAKLVAKEFNTEHHEVLLTAEQIPEAIENLVVSHDEPFGDAADIPLYLLCKNLKGKIKVILQGDGGDEIFAGYRRYRILSREPWWRLFSLAGNLSLPLLPDNPTRYRLRRFFQAMSDNDPAMRMALLLTMENRFEPPTRVFSPEVRELLGAHDPFRRYREMGEMFASLDPVQRMLYTDCCIVLPDLYLEKVDKSTMAHGIEVRVPLLDSELTDYVMAMPSGLKVRNGKKKWMLCKVMEDLLPPAITNGKKFGFGVPIGWWLKGPLAGYMKSVLLDSSAVQNGILQRPILERCIDAHIAGNRDHGSLLYKLMNFVLWQHSYRPSVGSF